MNPPTLGRCLAGAAALTALGVLIAPGIAAAHTASAGCVGSSAVFHAADYGGADTHPRFILDGSAPVAFAGSFSLTLPNATAAHHMVVKADDWVDIPLATPACVQPTTTTEASTTSTSTSTPSTSTISTVPAPSTTVASSTVPPDTTPSSSSSVPSPTTTPQPSTTLSTPTTEVSLTSQPGQMCNASSTDAETTPDSVTSTGCGDSSPPSAPGPSLTDASSGSAPSQPSSTLPHTGASDTAPLIAAGIAALVGGSALLFVARRRGQS